MDLEEQVARRADGPHRGRLPFAHEDDGLEAGGRGHGPGQQEQHQPGVRQQRGQLLVLVAIPVDEGRARRRGEPLMPEASGPEGRLDGADRTTQNGGRPAPSRRQPASPGGRQLRAAWQLDGRALPTTRVEEGLRLLDADVPRAPPEARRAVQRAAHDADGQRGHEQQEPRRREDPEQAEQVEGAHEQGAHRQPQRRDGIPGLVHGRQLGRVTSGIVGSADGELPHERGHQAGQREQQDEHDGEPHIGQQAPGGRAQVRQGPHSRRPTRASDMAQAMPCGRTKVILGRGGRSPWLRRAPGPRPRGGRRCPRARPRCAPARAGSRSRPADPG